jgi:molybdopterin synthase sulfur carrier subunit
VNLTILVFAQARDSFGFAERVVVCAPEETPRALLHRLAPGVSQEHLRVALDCEYVTWDTPVGEAAELAIIPPVSGG